MFDGTTHVYLTPVAAERADDFERFVREVVTPASDARRPDLAGRWRLLRPDDRDGEAVTFIFLFDGGQADDWDLVPVLEEHYGTEEAERLFEQWDEMSVPVRNWAEGLEGTGGDGQVGWTCSSVGPTAG
jgi:hypothetical protein